jgi:error-prone DNA polymerase
MELESIEKIWEMCLSFTGYSFCKPHSASYVQVSFQSAWLKAHYPAEMMAAVISNYGGFYTTQAYISEAQRLGITVFPPDVNTSLDKFKARDRRIRVGLCQIKGLSENGRKIILLERGAKGPYRDLHDLLHRTQIQESDAETLIYAGACDSLEPDANRAKLFWRMRGFFRTGRNCDAPELRHYPKRDLLRAEYKMLGFLTSCHPITLIPKKHSNVIPVNQVSRYIDKIVSFYGWCVTAKTVMTHQGDPMQFITFEDEAGICETVLFPDAYARYIRYLMRQEAFYITGKVMEEFGAITVEVRGVEMA